MPPLPDHLRLTQSPQCLSPCASMQAPAQDHIPIMIRWCGPNVPVSCRRVPRGPEDGERARLPRRAGARDDDLHGERGRTAPRHLRRVHAGGGGAAPCGALPCVRHYRLRDVTPAIGIFSAQIVTWITMKTCETETSLSWAIRIRVVILHNLGGELAISGWGLSKMGMNSVQS